MTLEMPYWASSKFFCFFVFFPLVETYVSSPFSGLKKILNQDSIGKVYNGLRGY